MKNLPKVITTGLVSASLVLTGTGVANASTLAPAVASTQKVAAPAASVTPVPKFWSAIFRLFMQFSKHATKQAASRNISKSTIKKVLNDGKVIQRQNGTATTQLGNVRVVVNVKTGKIITVYKVRR